ncbi:unnamed protein product [Calypogeia fissa]
MGRRKTSVPVETPGTERWPVPVGPSDNQRWLTFSKAHGKTHLPGIPNEFTMAQIVPKLSWKEFYTLSSVSPAWCEAIQSRRVYEERVRSRSTDKLILLPYMRGNFQVNSIIVSPVAVLAVDDELLAIVEVYNREEGRTRTFLTQSRGIGAENKEIIFLKAPTSLKVLSGRLGKEPDRSHGCCSPLRKRWR